MMATVYDDFIWSASAGEVETVIGDIICGERARPSSSFLSKSHEVMFVSLAQHDATSRRRCPHWFKHRSDSLVTSRFGQTKKPDQRKVEIQRESNEGNAMKRE